MSEEEGAGGKLILAPMSHCLCGSRHARLLCQPHAPFLLSEAQAGPNSLLGGWRWVRYPCPVPHGESRGPPGSSASDWRDLALWCAHSVERPRVVDQEAQRSPYIDL